MASVSAFRTYCGDHSKMEASLARLEERTENTGRVQEITLSELRELSNRLRPVEIQSARAGGESAERDRVQGLEPRWWTARIAAGALILSILIAIGGVLMAVFGG